MRDLFIILGSLLIAAVLAAFAVPRFIDWTPYKDEIEKRVAAASGLDLKLVGPVRLEFLPRLVLDADDVTLDTKDASASAAHLTLELSPASFLGGEPRIVSAKLDNGVIKLAPTLTTDPAAALVALMSRRDRPAVDALTLNTVSFIRDDDGSPLATIERGDGSLPARGGPLRLTAEGDFGGVAGRIRLAVGAPETESRRHVALAFDADGDARKRSWRLTFEGTAMKGTASPIALDGALVLAQGDKRASRPAGDNKPGGDNKDAALWRAQAKAHGELRSLVLDELEISRERAAALRLNGKGRLDFTGSARLTLDLSARRLVLDPLVEMPPPDNGVPPPDKNAPLRIDQAITALAVSFAAALPQELGVEFDIGAESVELADESFERFRIKGAGGADRLAISSLEGSWVGRGDVRFSGEVAPSHGGMQGHVDVKAADTAAFMQGFGLGESGGTHIPLTLAGELTFSPQIFRLEALDLTLSGSRITGSVTLLKAASGREPRIDADLSSQDLDLDAWPLGTVTGIIPTSLAGRLQVHVERLRAGRGAGEVGRLDMSLTRRSGETLIDELKLQGNDGLTLSGSGNIGGAGSSFVARISSLKAAPLLALSRLALPQAGVEALMARAGALEPLALTLTTKRDAASPNIDAALSGSVGGSRLDAKGALDALLAPLSGEAVLSAPEARSLLAQLGLAIGPGEPLGRGEARIAIKPSASGGMAASASLTAGEARLTGDGTLVIADATEGRGGFSAAMPNVAMAARLIGYAPRLEGDPRFEISGGWTLSPDALALDRLNIRLLGKALSGTLSLALGAQKRLTGEIRAPFLSVQALAALALGPIRSQGGQGAPGAAASTSTGQWASSRLPAFTAPPFPISLDISAPSAELGGSLTARDTRLTLELSERGLALTNASAAVSSGEIRGDWRIDRDGGLARSVLRLTADGLQVKDLVPGTSLAGQLSGRVELAGSGETAAQILASSGGGGTLRITGGTVAEADIAGLRRSFAKAVIDESLMDKQRFVALVAAETARGPLSGLRFEAPLIASSGTLKATVSRQELAPGDAAEGALTLDLKTQGLDARLGLSTISSVDPEKRVPLAATIIWKGPLSGPKRDVDPSALLQAVSIERLRLELERVELLEFDQREQAMFNRRLRSFRQKALPLPAPPEPPAAPAPGAPAQAAPEAAPPKANAAKPDPSASSTPAAPPQAAPPEAGPQPAPIVFAPAPGAKGADGNPPPP